MVVVFGLRCQSARMCLPARIGDGRFETTQIEAGVSRPSAVARPLHKVSAGADPGVSSTIAAGLGGWRRRAAWLRNVSKGRQ